MATKIPKRDILTEVSNTEALVIKVGSVTRGMVVTLPEARQPSVSAILGPEIGSSRCIEIVYCSPLGREILL